MFLRIGKKPFFSVTGMKEEFEAYKLQGMKSSFLEHSFFYLAELYKRRAARLFVGMPHEKREKICSLAYSSTAAWRDGRRDDARFFRTC
jgi:hypothetical protein